MENCLKKILVSVDKCKAVQPGKKATCGTDLLGRKAATKVDVGTIFWLRVSSGQLRRVPACTMHSA